MDWVEKCPRAGYLYLFERGKSGKSSLNLILFTYYRIYKTKKQGGFIGISPMGA